LEAQLTNSEETIEVIEPWHEVSLDVLPGRTQMGQAAKLALKHGWVVRAARTVSETKAWYRKNGNIVPAKTEEHLWVGGAKPNFEKPTRVFQINKMYIKKNLQPCTFSELKQFILEN
jgi:hypothetical protein